MKRFAAGLLLGLGLSAVPVLAEFGWTATEKLGAIKAAVTQMAADIAAIRKDGLTCNTK